MDTRGVKIWREKGSERGEAGTMRWPEAWRTQVLAKSTKRTRPTVTAEANLCNASAYKASSTLEPSLAVSWRLTTSYRTGGYRVIHNRLRKIRTLRGTSDLQRPLATSKKNYPYSSLAFRKSVGARYERNGGEGCQWRSKLRSLLCCADRK